MPDYSILTVPLPPSMPVNQIMLLNIRLSLTFPQTSGFLTWTLLFGYWMITSESLSSRSLTSGFFKGTTLILDPIFRSGLVNSPTSVRSSWPSAYAGLSAPSSFWYRAHLWPQCSFSPLFLLSCPHLGFNARPILPSLCFSCLWLGILAPIWID